MEVVDAELESRIEASYDTIPYGLLSHAKTHPIRLSTAAALRGVVAADVSACRVLELGCAEGGNLLHLAAAYPESTFVGIDLSGRQIEMARHRAIDLELTNLDLQHMDILDVGDSLGSFDYIIAHGVYSWVPPAVQQRVLRICRDHLAPNGVAAVSYNAYPGWHISGILRSLVFDVTRGVEDLGERVAMARGVLERVVADLATEAPYGALLTQYAQYALDNPDAYLAHDLLSEVNEPLWHAEFVRRANASDLQYVGNTDERADQQPANVGVTGYGDIISGNAFRIAVLCGTHHHLLDVPEPALVQSFVVGSATTSIDDLALAGALDESVVRFADSHGKVLRTGSPLMKALLAYLEHAWPRSVPLPHLTAWLDDVVPPECWPPATTHEHAVAALAVDLHRSGAAELSAQDYAVGDATVERPLTNRVARLAAALGQPVTNQRYDTVELDELLSFLLLYADGTRAIPALVDAAVAAVHEGALTLPGGDGLAITDVSVQRLALEGIVPRALEILADMALLVGVDSAPPPPPAHRESAIAPTAPSAIEASYDEFPYGFKSHPTSHVHRLATAAWLRKLDHAPVEQCRVLEIGCAEGGNLLPMAAAFPNSSFVGIDLSARQIELAKGHIAERQLTNVEVHQLDLTTLHDQYGDFDYIIAHGVYSWIPPQAQTSLLAACAARMTKAGLAYVSYNTYPGWQLKSVLRNLVLDRARGIDRVSDQIQAARQLLQQLSTDVRPNSPYGAMMGKHIELILRSDDAYIAHEYLTPVNEAISVVEFARRAAEHGLEFVDDLVASAGDPTMEFAAQQYHDLKHGTAFRGTLLCRAGREMGATPAGRLLSCWVASKLTCGADAVLDDDSLVAFTVGERGSISTASPVVKSALAHLVSIWPEQVRIYDLAATMVNRGLTAGVSSGLPDVADHLSRQLLRLFRNGVIDLSISHRVVVQP